MQLGMIGLGRMGANMVRRLMRGGHQCVVWDMNQTSVQGLAGEGATGAAKLISRLRLSLRCGRLVESSRRSEFPLLLSLRV